MAVKKDATELAQALQGALNELSKGGQLAAMFERHNVTWHAV
jgi:ABC-type amino acid transport substrate-binding protein